MLWLRFLEEEDQDIIMTRIPPDLTSVPDYTCMKSIMQNTKYYLDNGCPELAIGVMSYFIFECESKLPTLERRLKIEGYADMNAVFIQCLEELYHYGLMYWHSPKDSHNFRMGKLDTKKDLEFIKEHNLNLPFRFVVDCGIFIRKQYFPLDIRHLKTHFDKVVMQLGKNECFVRARTHIKEGDVVFSEDMACTVQIHRCFECYKPPIIAFKSGLSFCSEKCSQWHKNNPQLTFLVNLVNMENPAQIAHCPLLIYKVISKAKRKKKDPLSIIKAMSIVPIEEAYATHSFMVHNFCYYLICKELGDFPYPVYLELMNRCYTNAINVNRTIGITRMTRHVLKPGKESNVHMVKINRSIKAVALRDIQRHEEIVGDFQQSK